LTIKDKNWFLKIMSILKQSTLKETPQSRKIELRLLIVTAILLLFGLGYVYLVKTQKPLNFAELPEMMQSKEVEGNGQKVKKLPAIVNFKSLKTKEDWWPYLVKFEDENDRNLAAEKLAGAVNSPKRTIENVGYLGTVRVDETEIEANKELVYYPKKMDEARARDEQRRQNASYINVFRNYLSSFRQTEKPTVTVSVLGGLGALKNSFIARSPGEFKTSLIIWSAIFFLAFISLHCYWRWRKFDGDGLILPPIFLLCGIGYLMMISFRDPLRDTLLFADFAFGAAVGCLMMAAVTSLDFYHLYFLLAGKLKNWTDFWVTYTPISAAILLSVLLITVGSSPGASDAKVNLNIPLIGLVQPSEIIRILFALFVALYFGERWEYVRFLEEEKVKGWFSIPRIKDVALVGVFVLSLILLFIAQKDLGPALLMAGLFLIIYAIVRHQIWLSLAGFLVILGIYAANYYVWTFSVTAVDRLKIWWDPWDTNVSGGEQIVHSFWSFADGGWFGAGLGLGDPNFAPAHHTDLILASIGNELGFVGILLIFSIYGLLFYRCYLIAKHAFSPFTYLLGLGLGVINALQLIFIFSAVLGIIPLSGVVTPFLSQGMSSMIGNFISFGILSAISNEPQREQTELVKPTKFLAIGFVVLVGLVLTQAWMIQVWQSDRILVRGVLTPVPDEEINGVKVTNLRRFTYNPRIALAKKQLPFGSIYDRHGIPLASNNWEELTKFEKEYESLGVYLSDVCQKGKRCYPFGNKIFHLIGNYSSEKNKDVTKTNRVEIEYESILRGYNDFAEKIPFTVQGTKPILDDQNQPQIDPTTQQILEENVEIKVEIVKRDYMELIPLIRNRYNFASLEANLLRYKNRQVKTSFDIRLQIRLTNLIKTELLPKKQKGAIVVLEPKTGDLLAAVNFPFPDEDLTENQKAIFDDSDAFFDRSRAGTYPPGSTFKVVTAMAALRKDPNAKEFLCLNLSGGRVGNVVRNREIKDDFKDKLPHNQTDLKKGLTVSCNAYFAQLGENLIGSAELFKTAELFEIATARPNNAAELNKYLPQAAFGQGEVLTTPFQMGKVAAAIANGGVVPDGRWVTDENNKRNAEPVQVLPPEQTAKIAGFLRNVVSDPNGTGKKLAQNPVQIAGKTGTAENGKTVNGKYIPLNSHSWFMGFAPYNNPNQRIAFAVIVENGGYGGGIAARLSDELVTISTQLGIIQ
jgi:cell division protein FtsI/penicillin-binding protein 2/cell division protein FtsW (lipid II flippase)